MSAEYVRGKETMENCDLLQNYSKACESSQNDHNHKNISPQPIITTWRRTKILILITFGESFETRSELFLFMK